MSPANGQIQGGDGLEKPDPSLFQRTLDAVDITALFPRRYPQLEQRLLDDKLEQPGAYMVMMGGLPIPSLARTNFVKLHHVEMTDERGTGKCPALSSYREC